MRKILACILISFSLNAESLDTFFAALAKVESSNNPKAINTKETALGIYQIRPAYFKDAGVKAKHSDVFKPEIAKRVVLAYFQKYEPTALKNLDFETLARCHNGGCGWRRNKSATNMYWQKVKRFL